MLGITRHCYILNIKAVGPMVSEDFQSFPIEKSRGALCCNGYQHESFMQSFLLPGYA